MGEERKIQPLEDRALKVGVKFFGQEALPLLGIKDRFLQKEELVWMLLTPLMNGTRTVAEYITKCAALLKKEQKNQEKQDFLRMEAILYAFAVKFLSSEE